MNNFFLKEKRALYIAITFVTAIFFIVDRFLKNKALDFLGEYNLVGSFLKFNFTANEYIAFSLPVKGVFFNIILLILIFLIFVFCIFLWYKKKYEEFFGFLLIFSGALSNLIDRFKHSFVIDYLDLMYFTVFNLADVLIFCGSVFLLFFYFKQKPENKFLK